QTPSSTNSWPLATLALPHGHKRRKSPASRSLLFVGDRVNVGRSDPENGRNRPFSNDYAFCVPEPNV
ncbi:hypothetical protein OAF24_04905, partial [bacterium]|nr:hypothetical protein [bacterium]